MKKFWRHLVSAILSFTFCLYPTVSEATIPTWSPCSISANTFCISGISVFDSNGREFVGSPSGRIRESTEIVGGQKVTGNVYEWQIPGIVQENGTDKMLVNIQYVPLGSPYCWLPNQVESTCDFSVDQLRVDVTPSWWDSQPKPVHFENEKSDLVCGTKANPSPCILAWNLSSAYTYQVRLKLPQDFVPGLLVGEGAPSGSKKSLEVLSNGELALSGKPAARAITMNTELRPIFETQAKADINVSILNFWLSSNRASAASWFNRCRKNDSMTLWENAQILQYPSWSTTDQSLSLQLTAPHFSNSGEINKGQFQIEMPTHIAQCLWGVDLSRAIQATVSASYSDSGTPEIVTTSSKTVDSTYFLYASGFHFSSPKISVSLRQEETPVAPIQEIVASPQPKVETKSTVVCTKGKVIRKVTALKPVCPKGFAKKK